MGNVGFKMVLYPLLPAEVLCVIINHKSISSFEIYNSDSKVKHMRYGIFIV